MAVCKMIMVFLVCLTVAFAEDGEIRFAGVLGNSGEADDTV
mgnify:CR=1 FL=1